MNRRQFLRNTFAVTLTYSLSGCNEAGKGLFKKEKNKRQRPNILFCIADDASYPHMGGLRVFMGENAGVRSDSAGWDIV